MTPITFDGLDVEIIRQEPIWETFLDALAEFYNTEVRPDLSQLEEIRDIKEGTHVGFVELTLRNMGITLPLDILVEPERLYNSVYMIPLLYQVLGTDAAFRAIAFILGRRVKVTPLYTENYAEFYKKPYGPLRIDGGTWYKTTHIELEMQRVGSDATLFIPRGQTLRDRLLDAFFSLAPYNIVVDQFFTTIEAELDSTFFCGDVIKEPLRRIVADEVFYADLTFRIVGPDQVTAGDVVRYYLMNNHNKQIMVDTWNCAEAPIDNGVISFPPADQDRVVRIRVEVDGIMLTKDVQVFMPITNVQFVEIVGPASIRSGTNAYYEVLAHHDGGPTRINTQIVVSSSVARMLGDYLNTDEVPANETVGLAASFTAGGIEYNVAKLVELRAVNPNVALTALIVTGPQQVQEASVYSYNATAHFTDGSSEFVTALWETTSAAAYIENGDLTTTNVLSTVDFKVAARFSYRGVTMADDLPVTLVSADREIQGIEIVGTAIMYTETKAQFTCIISYTDGSSTSVTPKWNSSLFDIDDEGILSVGLVRAETELLITAEIYGVTASHSLTLKKAPVELTQLTIQGAGSVNEGSISNYTCVGLYSDGTSRAVNADWSLPNDEAWATFVGGDLLFYGPQSDSILIQATYDGMTQTKTVICIPISNTITSLFISGPNTVAARSRILLTATVQYEDGTFETVDPQWTVYTDDSNADFVAADASSRGFIIARDVDEDMQVIVRARYFALEAEWPVTVTFVAPTSPDRPVSSRIIGPTLFYNNQIASFAQAIVFEAHPTKELLVSSDWYIEEDIAGVMIDENGFVTSTVTSDVTFTIKAVYQCRDVYVEDFYIVTSLPANDEVVEFNITGSNYIEVGQSEIYSATVVTDQDVTKVVSADWYALSDSLNIQISNGIVRVVGPVVNQTLTLAAAYGNKETTITINIGQSAPLYSSGSANETVENIVANSRKIANNQIVDTFDGFGYILYPSVFGVAGIVQDGVAGLWTTPKTVSRVINGVNTVWYKHRSNNPILGQVTLNITYS